MAARLTDKQKKKIIADYVQLGSYNAVSKIHGVSATTVKNVVLKSADIVEKCEQKKEQNTLDMLAFMDSRKEKAQDIIDIYLAAMVDPERVGGASLTAIATSLGIVVDKFTKNTRSGGDSLDKLDDLLKEFKDAVKPETD